MKLSLERLAKRIAALSSGGAGGGSMKAGDLVVLGPSGLPPSGLRGFETVEDYAGLPDPTTRPEGSRVFNRAGTMSWVRQAGQWRADAQWGALYGTLDGGGNGAGISQLVALQSATSDLMALASEFVHVMAAAHETVVARPSGKIGSIRMVDGGSFADNDWFGLPLSGGGVQEIEIQTTNGYVSARPLADQLDMRGLASTADQLTQLDARIGGIMAELAREGYNLAPGTLQSISYCVRPGSYDLGLIDVHVADARCSASGFSLVKHDAAFVSLAGTPFDVVVPGLRADRAYEVTLEIGGGPVGVTCYVLPNGSGVDTHALLESINSTLLPIAPARFTSEAAAGWLVATSDGTSDGIMRGRLSPRVRATAASGGHQSHWESSQITTVAPAANTSLLVRTIGDTTVDFTSLTFRFSNNLEGWLRVVEVFG